MSADRTATSARPTAGVVGGGIAGLTAAYVLSRTHDVTLYEAEPRLGGHAHTHDVTDSAGQHLRIDSGFIVHNERTYPHLLRLFRELGVETQPTEMSMSITCEGCGLSYAGGRGASGLFAQGARLLDPRVGPRYLRLLTEVPLFHRRARALLAAADAPGAADSSEAADPADASFGPTWGEFLAGGGYSDYFVRHFAVPLVACVWSAGDGDARSYPALHLFRFLDHHGMLTVSGSPTWRTVVGGSRSYVDALAGRLGDVRPGRPVTAVERREDVVQVRTADGHLTEHDRVVVATHADDTLGLLADATPDEKDALRAIGYSHNVTLLHRDGSVLPSVPGARASWNYRMRSCRHQAQSVPVSYWMNRLHGLSSPDDFVVTLNPGESVDPGTVVASMEYRHPIFTPEAVSGAARLRNLGGARLAFAGAHLGWGFHEDGCRSGVQAAERLGVQW